MEQEDEADKLMARIEEIKAKGLKNEEDDKIQLKMEFEEDELIGRLSKLKQVET